MRSVVVNRIYTFLPARVKINIVTVIQWNVKKSSLFTLITFITRKTPWDLNELPKRAEFNSTVS
jgi:hypothetical protein